MKKKIKYTNEKIGKHEVVKDFLPSPSDLAFKEENVKITMSLSRTSVTFFKKQAQKHSEKLIDACYLWIYNIIGLAETVVAGRREIC